VIEQDKNERRQSHHCAWSDMNQYSHASEGRPQDELSVRAVDIASEAVRVVDWLLLRVYLEASR
jgi:hypothetical protein